MTKLKKSLDAWKSTLGGDSGQDAGIDYAAFMQEFQQLRAKFNETHDTEAYKSLYALSEKYGFDHAEQMKFSRLNNMLYWNADKQQQGMELGSIPADRLDDLLKNGKFSEALRLVKDSLDEQKLTELQGDHEFFVQLAKSDYKSSDYLLSGFFSLVRKDGVYVISADKDQFQQALDNLGVYNNFSADIDKIRKSFLDFELPLPGEDDAQKKVSDNFEHLSREQEQSASQGRHR